jgi:ribose/xylose/arabinose/galactoside ABC-type transport system permease subunit
MKRYLGRYLGPLGGLVGIFALFTVLLALARGLSFADPANLETLLRQTTIVATAALGMTAVIIAGGIDLSVGAVIALVTVVIAAALRAGAPPLVAALAGVGTGLAAGLVNGALVTRLRVVPFIVTLGTMLLIRGAAKGIAHEQKLDAPPSWLDDLLARTGDGHRWMLLPAGVWLLLLLALATAALLSRTRPGRYIFAVGSNEEAARLSGVPVTRVKLLVYGLGGLATGVAGLMQFSRLTEGDPSGAQGLELDVIAAVVIGGGSLAGGQGSVLGSLIGALIMQVLQSGCAQMSWPNWVQEIVTGAIIVAAVSLDRFRRLR